MKKRFLGTINGKQYTDAIEFQNAYKKIKDYLNAEIHANFYDDESTTSSEAKDISEKPKKQVDVEFFNHINTLMELENAPEDSRYDCQLNSGGVTNLNYWTRKLIAYLDETEDYLLIESLDSKINRELTKYRKLLDDLSEGITDSKREFESAVDAFSVSAEKTVDGSIGYSQLEINKNVSEALCNHINNAYKYYRVSNVYNCLARVSETIEKIKIAQ